MVGLAIDIYSNIYGLASETEASNYARFCDFVSAEVAPDHIEGGGGVEVKLSLYKLYV